MTMLDWIMRRFGASIEELAREQYEELLGFAGTGDETVDTLEGKGGHKPMRHDIGKLKQIYDIYNGTFDADAGRTGPPRDPQKKVQWDDMTLLDAREKQADLIYREVARDIEDPASTGWFEGDEDPFKATLEVLTGKHPYWHAIVDLALRTTDTAGLTADSSPLWTEEDARQLLSAGQRKKQIAEAPRIFGNIRDALGNLLHNAPESYKLWPWMVKQLKDPSYNQQYGGISHMIDVVGNAGKVLAELRRQNQLPQNFDINKMDFDGLEKWYMDYKKENRSSESQGEVVYSWDDGWTMQRLTDEAQLQYEGDEMGHCVGDYGHHVDSGASIIYSLRDPKGNPHVTMEMEGPQLLKQLHDKPMSEFDSNDVEDLKLGQKMRKGDVYPAPLFKDGQDHDAYQYHRDSDRETIWPNYLTERGYVTPHNMDENETYYNSKGIPWDKSFYVVQVQGNSNATPKPEYQARVKEFMDYLKSKGFNFERSSDWYAPHDDRGEDNLGGWEDYRTYAIRDNSFSDHRDNTLGWFNHYQEHPETYLGDEDQYGIKRDKKSSGFAPGVIQDTLNSVIDEGEDPTHAAQSYLHLVMNEDWPYADVDAAVRHAANKMQSQANDEHETNWQTDNGTWIYHNPETGQDEEVEDYDDMPEDSYFSADEDPKYQDGYKFINAVDQYLAWYYNNKDDAQKDRHPSMNVPKLKWIGDNVPDGFVEGTDPYAATPDEQAKADQQAQQDAGPGFSTTDMSGVFSSVHVAEREHDPDYLFVYYMSELRVEEWEQHRTFESVFEALLDEFNVDLGNTLMDIDPQDVAAGDIRIRKGKPEVEHKQLCPPEIREQAEDAISGWWAKQWFEGLEHDWYEVDESHTLTGDGNLDH